MRLTLVACLAAFPAYAQDPDVGRALYHNHCATCHGLEGQGDGPMSGVLLVPPADLTALSLGNAGDFPVERVVKRIDGRDPLVSHGSPMPVYGPFFEGRFDVPLPLASGEPVMTSQPVVNIVTFLRELQRTE